MKACEELGIVSPLALVGLTKAEIRQYQKNYRLRHMINRQMLVLASRFPYDTHLTKEN